VASKDSYLYCLKPDGNLNWKFKVDSAITSSPVISKNNVVFVTTLNRFYSVSSSGISLWNNTEEGIPYGSNNSPAIGEDGVVYLSVNHKYPDIQPGLYAFNSNGTIKWSAPLSAPLLSSPTIGDNGIIYLPTGPTADGISYLRAIKPDGTIQWSYPLGDKAHLSTAGVALDGTIYVGCADYYFYAINPDGTLKWRYLFTSSLNGSILAIDGAGVILVNDGHSSLTALNPDGTLKIKFGGNLLSNFSRIPVIASGGRIYWGHAKGLAGFYPPK